MAMYDFIISGKYDEHLAFLRKQIRKRRDFMAQLVDHHLGIGQHGRFQKEGCFYG
nr:hypothetical protein [Salicibibacter halophilus]